MGIKPGDSGVVIGYQVDEFTCTHFSLELGCEDYSFLYQAMADFEQGFDSILTDSLETPELDTSLDELDAILSSVSSGFLHLVSSLSVQQEGELTKSKSF